MDSYYLYYYHIRQGSICHGDEPSLIGILLSLRSIVTESRKDNAEFAEKLEMNCLQNIIFLNGQLELKKEWKKKYGPTFRPLMKQIPILRVLTFQTSWIFKIALLAIRLCPVTYLVFRKIYRIIRKVAPI
jgi:hypothetical protein